ncbi:MAG: hypothetical protein H3Z53_06660 [archaeon]|nr:hypothetical protein [archaeon]
MLMLEDLLSVVLMILIISIASGTTVLAYLFSNFFKGSPFERPWKTLLSIPFFLLGIGIIEALDITILRLRSLLALAALVMMLYTYYQFYQTVTFVQPYKGVVRATVGAEVNKSQLKEEKEKILIRKDIYDKLVRMAERRGITINQMVYTIIVPEWLESRRFEPESS